MLKNKMKNENKHTDEYSFQTSMSCHIIFETFVLNYMD